MESNVDTRQPLTEKQIVRNLAMVLANARREVEEKDTLDSKDRLQRVEALLDHFIEITVDQDVIATWTYKPLKIKELYNPLRKD